MVLKKMKLFIYIDTEWNRYNSARDLSTKGVNTNMNSTEDIKETKSHRIHSEGATWLFTHKTIKSWSMQGKSTTWYRKIPCFHVYLFFILDICVVGEELLSNPQTSDLFAFTALKRLKTPIIFTIVTSLSSKYKICKCAKGQKVRFMFVH